MELYIYNKNLDCIGLLEKFDSLIWKKKYYKAGNFELYCSFNSEALELLQIENLIYKKNDDELGIIEYRQLGLDITGKEILIVKGKFVTNYLSRRFIWGTNSFDDTMENCMRSIVNENCINPVNKNRIIHNLFLGDLKNFEQRVNYQVGYKNVLEELEKLSRLSQLGFKISFDSKNKKLFFNIYEGLDRTAKQNINARCIFNKNFENVLKQNFTESIDNFKNITLVAGGGQGNERKFLTVGEEESSGINRFELFVDARDIQEKIFRDNKEIIIPQEKYLKMLAERGNIKLAEYKKNESFTSEINILSNLIYKKDFDLGDMVTCANKTWGITLDRRITEIDEEYTKTGLKITAIFGEELPTLLDKIKQDLN